MTISRCLPFVLKSLVALVLLAPASLLAQDGGDLDVTMRMVADDDDLSGGLIQELQLPEAPAGVAGSRQEGGRDRPDELREQGRSLGRDVSEEARGRREERSTGRPDSHPVFSPDNPRDKFGDDRPAPDDSPGARPGDRPGNQPDPGGRP